ncbi:hypothetical protein Syun_022374 [Stephania yunnanensis]|uniref:Pre-mRNA-processing protein 40C n=1 Tax=Stephania yunnanensis TaxID=152371 RepID=A0AAP0HYH0_9MAGN
MAHSTPSANTLVGQNSPKSPIGNANNTLQDPARTTFSTAAGVGVPPPSFSYGVVPNAPSASESSMQPSATPAMKSSQPASASALLHPPVPGQSSTTRPSFSYGINTHNNIDSLNSQQFTTSSAIGSGHSQCGKSATSVATVVQSPVQAPAGHPNVSITGTSDQVVQDPLPSPVPVPNGAPSVAAGFSFSRASQSLAAVDAMQKDTSLKSHTLGHATQDGGAIPPASTSSQSVSLPANSPATSSLTPLATSNFYPTIRMPAAPSIPGMPRTLAIPGPPGIPPFPPMSTNVGFHSTPADSSSGVQRPIVSSTVSLPPNLSGQQLVYPSYLSAPAVAVPPQMAWMQPQPVGGLPRPPFMAFSGVPPGPFPLAAHGVMPPVSLPNPQVPAIAPVGPPGYASASVGLGPPAGSSLLQPELPPPGIDYEKKADVDGAAVINVDVNAWTAHRTETGAVYFYNAVSGESTYDRPSGFEGESDKLTVQPTPVSMEKLAGTDWALVTTDVGKKYYHNDKTKVSSWQIPKEVAELRKEDGGSLNASAVPVQNASALAEKVSIPTSLSAPAINTGGRDATPLRPSAAPGSSSALDLIKKKLQEPGLPITSSPLPASSGTTISELNGSRSVDATTKGPQGESSKDRQNANGDGNLSDSSSDSEDLDSGPTKEECIIQFKEMLKERGVAPFSKWEKELPKILFDPRFKAVPGHSTRRSLFEHYVRTRAEEERKEKRAAQKAAIEGFKQLLEEASEEIDHKIDYQSFKKKWGSDPRFEALDRKERELLLNERVLPLKKAADEKIQAIRAASAASFKSMLQDKGGITMSTRWSRVKDSLRNDPRYKSVKHEDREAIFNEYISELKAAEEEAERVSKAKREEQDKLRERERETRKRKEREEQEMERVRLKIRRKEAVASYQALLVETIKDPLASWTESKPKLDKDPQGRAANSDLDQADMEKLFREHVKSLYERRAREFRSLLSEVLTVEAAAQVPEDGKTVLTSWSTAKQLLKPDPRYSKMPRKEKESLWRRYAEEMLRKQNSAPHTNEDKLYTETKGRSSLDSRKRSPSGSRRTHGRR